VAQWINVVKGFIPNEAFSTALKDKPFKFYMSRGNFGLAVIINFVIILLLLLFFFIMIIFLNVFIYLYMCLLTLQVNPLKISSIDKDNK